MLDLSPTKLIIIFIVVIVLLGPKRLPQVARQLGAWWRKIVGFQQQVERELRETMPDLPSSQDIVRFARSPVSMLNQLADFPSASADAPVEDPGAPAPGSATSAADGTSRAAGTAAVPNGNGSSDGDGHWPEDRSSGAPTPLLGRPVPEDSGSRSAVPPSVAPSVPTAGPPAPRQRPLADLASLAADDPTMN